MDAPLGITFFKKVELYQKISSLDEQASEMIKRGGWPPLWPIEKKVLTWAYSGHKHLGSPITTSHFDSESGNSKLEDFKITLQDMRNVHLTRLLDSFVAHGFASEILEGRLYTSHTPDENSIYITREGMLAGEVLHELNSLPTRTSYWVWGKLWGHFGAFLLLAVSIIAIIKMLK